MQYLQPVAKNVVEHTKKNNAADSIAESQAPAMMNYQTRVSDKTFTFYSDYNF